MKKVVCCLGAASVLGMVLSSSATAQSVNPVGETKWFKEIVMTENAHKQIYLEQADSEYYFIHNKGKALDSKALEKYIKSGFAIKPELAQKKLYDLVGVGVFKSGDTTYTDFLFDSKDKASLEEIRANGKSRALKTKKKAEEKAIESLGISTEGDAPNYVDSYNWTFEDSYNNNIDMGNFTSNVSFTRQGTTTYNGRLNSVWDVKYFDESEPVNSYQTKEVVTRSSVQAFNTQDLITYGPFTTSSQSTAEVNLSGLMPSFTWQFQTNDSTVTNDSSTTYNYGRWIFKTALGTNTAKFTSVTEPGARFTNYSGNFGIEHSHTAEYYKNLSANDIGYTGVVQRFLPDL